MPTFNAGNPWRPLFGDGFWVISLRQGALMSWTARILQVGRRGQDQPKPLNERAVIAEIAAAGLPIANYSKFPADVYFANVKPLDAFLA
jgi:hypothetical protein